MTCFIYDNRCDTVVEGAKEDGFAFIDLNKLYIRKVRCASGDGSIESDMEVGDISMYVDVLVDNVDSLNMNSENEYYTSRV